MANPQITETFKITLNTLPFHFFLVKRTHYQEGAGEVVHWPLGKELEGLKCSTAFLIERWELQRVGSLWHMVSSLLFLKLREGQSPRGCPEMWPLVSWGNSPSSGTWLISRMFPLCQAVGTMNKLSCCAGCGWPRVSRLRQSVRSGSRSSRVDGDSSHLLTHPFNTFYCVSSRCQEW